MADKETSENQKPPKSKEERLVEIEAQLTDLSERLGDLKQQYFKGKLSGPEADRLGIPLRKQRKKLVEEKYDIIGGKPNPNELCDEDDD